MPSYKLCYKYKHIILFTAYKAYLSVSYIFSPIHILLLLVFYFNFLALLGTISEFCITATYIYSCWLTVCHIKYVDILVLCLHTEFHASSPIDLLIMTRKQ
jgi:hypothetical protein